MGTTSFQHLEEQKLNMHCCQGSKKASSDKGSKSPEVKSGQPPTTAKHCHNVAEHRTNAETAGRLRAQLGPVTSEVPLAGGFLGDGHTEA